MKNDTHQFIDDLLERVIPQNPKQLFEMCSVSHQDEVFEEEATLKIDGVTLNQKGDIMGIVGKQKSGKSTVLILMLLNKIGGMIHKSKGVLWIDTEMSPSTAIKRLRQMEEEGVDTSKIEYICLRKYSYYERRGIVEMLRDHSDHLKQKFDEVVIDGIRDLSKSINNDEEAQQIMDLLMTLSGSGFAVYAVLHTNKTSNTPRGHLGTELQNKCISMMSVTRQQEIGLTIGSFINLREGDTNQEIIYDGEELKVSHHTDDPIDNLLDFIQEYSLQLQDDKLTSSKNLLLAIKNGFDLKDTQAKERIKSMRQLGYIEQVKRGLLKILI